MQSHQQHLTRAITVTVPQISPLPPPHDNSVENARVIATLRCGSAKLVSLASTRNPCVGIPSNRWWARPRDHRLYNDAVAHHACCASPGFFTRHSRRKEEMLTSLRHPMKMKILKKADTTWLMPDGSSRREEGTALLSMPKLLAWAKTDNDIVCLI